MRLFDRSNKAGFTLVELIVVIAILAILAGIAIPVYSGYIKKAHKAADYEVLDAVNMAFAAACAENRVRPAKLSGCTIEMTGKCITGVSVPSIPAEAVLTGFGVNDGIVTSTLGYGDGVQFAELAATTADLATSFGVFFGNNSQVELKYFDSVDDFTYVQEEGIFKATEDLNNGGGGTSNGVQLLSSQKNDDGTTTYTFNVNGEEVDFTISDTAIAAFESSTFGTNMTVNELMSDVTGMTTALTSALNSGNTLAGLIDSALQNNDPPSSLEALGITTDEDGNYDLNQLANATVLMVAANTNEDTTSALITGLSSGSPSDINAMISSGNLSSRLGNMAGLYGIATSFASSDAAEGWSTEVDGKTYNATEYYAYVNGLITDAASADVSMNQKIKNITNAMGMLSAYMYEDPTAEEPVMTSNFAAYSTAGSDGTSQLEKDANGYVGAMNAIAGNIGAVASTGAMDDGYSGGAIGEILNQLFGG